MRKPRRTLALLAYLLPVLGWLYVLLFHRKDEFAVYHARQSMMITIVAIGAPVIWGAAAWILTWLPLAGPIIAAAAFALVVLTYILLAATWIIGIVYASQAKMKPIPVIGGWTERILAG